MVCYLSECLSESLLYFFPMPFFRISYYISDPTTVSVQVTKMKEIEFPTVTICNENIVSKSLADHLPGND